MKVILVGAGPGDPGLLTLAGREALAGADVVVYDALANRSFLDYARKGAELIYVGKIADQHALPQDAINELLAAKARENGGKNVVRLKGGDPYIFGRGGEEAEYLRAQGVPFEEIPGISSAIAAPAYAGIPLTHRYLTSAVTIVTGHENPAKAQSALNWRALAESRATLVFLMGMRNIGEISANLIGAGMCPEMPAAVVYRGTTPLQRTVEAPLGQIAAAAAELSNPAVIIIGRVVEMRSKLDWFSSKPLLGRRIVVTRAREQASGMANALAGLGAAVSECPAIDIRPLEDYAILDAAIDRIADYDWLIFTSANGVKYFWERLARAGKDSRALAGAKVAVIGPATGEALRERGIAADLTPQTYVAESVAESLMARQGEGIEGLRVLLPRAQVARSALPDELARAGAIVDVAPAYKAVPAAACGEEVRGLLAANLLDCVSFGSSSTVRNFLDVVPANLLLASSRVKLAAIGPITAETLREYGLKAEIMPAKFTIPALVKAIAGYFSNRNCEEPKCP